MKDLTTALQNINMTYQQLVEISNEIVSKCTKKSDDIVKQITENTENLSNDALRTSMLNLSLTAYSFCEIKEKAAMKAECAEIVRKELYAKEFNGADGSVAVRENIALLNSSEEVLAETVYNLVSATLKVKLDEIHRIVDTLKIILTSRLSEAKLTQSISVGDVGESTYIKE